MGLILCYDCVNVVLTLFVIGIVLNYYCIRLTFVVHYYWR